SLAFASDGTSNTAAFSEKICSNAQGTAAGTVTVPCTKVKGGMTRSDTGPVIYVSGSPKPDACLTGAYGTDRTELVSAAEIWNGQILADGRSLNCGFHTVLPPNSPSCGHGASGGGAGGWGISSVTSNHRGGVNLTMLDGSVHFIADGIDCGNLAGIQGGHQEGTNTSPCNSGASNYGVWGAMGTPQGGESKGIE
ncbi:MAG: DUF1559 domain-containing protein, partial [Planctomycetaceae bacterium]|nr:DUF1559 domain-containing protein [Planctomycetaceae bacterium]